MLRRSPHFQMILALWMGLTCAAVVHGVEAKTDKKLDAASVEFFETKIRPVLVDRCYSCHTNGIKTKGGLAVDSRHGLLKGGDSGPALVPGQPEKSLILKAIKYKDDDLKMPPKEQLPPEDVANIEAWVRMGAPDPREEVANAAIKSGPINWDEAKAFWSYKKPQAQTPPKCVRQAWLKTPVDAFILAKLEEKGLKPSAPADKRTLIRRATYDLTGLAPTADEVDAFLKDEAPDAFAKVVDRLLASPLYGERWGRHWLDVARYADTKGYVFQEERRYAFSYTYRDWVIKALNDDMPYDQFVQYQLAADRLVAGPEKADKQHLAALGYLTLGRRFINIQPDIIDDRIDVTFRGLQGLTVTCARCHDHKYDPFPTKDYYSLYGVFASSNEPKELPQIGLPKDEAMYKVYLEEVKKADAELLNLKTKKYNEKLLTLRKAEKLDDYLLGAKEARENPGEKVSAIATKRDVIGHVLDRWIMYLKTEPRKTDPAFTLWLDLAALKDADFAAKSKDLIANSKGNALVKKAFTEKPPANIKEAAVTFANLLVANGQEAAHADADKEALRLALYDPKAPPSVPFTEAEKIFNRDDENKLRELRKKVEGLHITHPGAPSCAMAMEDAPTPTEPQVFIRGNANNKGEKVPRKFLTVLSDVSSKPFTDGSGRLELARAIASPNNPLTARVMVNRVWAQHFGMGLVRTPSDFGIRGDKPTHPELLDDLAVRFMSEGWSLKRLHKLIMLSSTYQQASDDIAEDRTLDPENTLLWRQNRRRLEFEAMRDSLLQAAGHLSPAIGGKPVNFIENPTTTYKMEGEMVRVVTDDPSKDSFSLRRSVYLFIDRQNLPGLFRTFDFASPDVHSPRRYSTTVPQQALFMMNSPFVVEQAQFMLKRPEILNETQTGSRVTALYRTLFGRAPNADELKLADEFLKLGDSASNITQPKPKVILWSYGYGEYDEATKRIKNFTKLGHRSGDTWQVGPKVPDEKLGFVLINKDGGHPGNDAAHAAIRRWTAPEDGEVSIKGKLKHPEKVAGDGVRGRIVSSSGGELGVYVAFGVEKETKVDAVKVKAGDTLDFAVDCQTSPNTDAFQWTPVLSFKAANGTVTEYNARNEYNPVPPKPIVRLTAWEKYVQVLLLSNEFMFVD